MSPPLTVSWKDQSFHVCGGEEMSCRRGEDWVVVGWAVVWVFIVLSNFCSEEEAEERGGVTCTEIFCIFLYAMG